MLKRVWAFALLMLMALPGQTAPPSGPERTFTARDLFGLEVAADPQISPDGRWIAYVRRTGDIMTDRYRPAIWLIDTRSGEQMPLVAGTGAHSQPRWSPNGDRIAYISTAEGDRPQLFVRWMGSGEAVRITGNKPYVFSTDYPHEVDADTCKHELEELRENTQLSTDDKEAILYGNSQRFYQLPVSVQTAAS